MPINPPAEKTRIEAITSDVQARVYFNRKPIALLLAVIAAGMAGAISPLAVVPVAIAVVAGLLL